MKRGVLGKKSRGEKKKGKWEIRMKKSEGNGRAHLFDFWGEGGVYITLIDISDTRGGWGKVKTKCHL